MQHTKRPIYIAIRTEGWDDRASPPIGLNIVMEAIGAGYRGLLAFTSSFLKIKWVYQLPYQLFTCIVVIHAFTKCI